MNELVISDSMEICVILGAVASDIAVPLYSAEPAEQGKPRPWQAPPSARGDRLEWRAMSNARYPVIAAVVGALICLAPRAAHATFSIVACDKTGCGAAVA